MNHYERVLAEEQAYKQPTQIHNVLMQDVVYKLTQEKKSEEFSSIDQPFVPGELC